MQQSTVIILIVVGILSVLLTGFGVWAIFFSGWGKGWSPQNGDFGASCWPDQRFDSSCPEETPCAKTNGGSKTCGGARKFKRVGGEWQACKWSGGQNWDCNSLQSPIQAGYPGGVLDKVWQAGSP